jgi:hypothetical protein
VKLKYKEVKEYRLEQLAQQNHCCALCGAVIEDDAVLDHDHKTGLLRQVLHRGCNSMLGKIENNMPRSRMDLQTLRVFAERLVDYIETTHTDIRHPTHRTSEEKIMMKKQAMGRGRGRGKKPPKR